MLSKITHIPQPSLSRFFNSNAMPRRRTLLKIAEALNLDAVRVIHNGTLYQKEECKEKPIKQVDSVPEMGKS